MKVRHEGGFLIGGIVDHHGEFGRVLVGERVAGVGFTACAAPICS